MDSKKVELKKTKKFGRAVFAKAEIPKGHLIATFDGPFYDNDFDDWTEDLLNHAIQCGPSLWRDSKGLARYLNHSCDPNCGIKGRFKVVAMRNIKKGEQITWDYEMTEKSNWWKMKCQCGSANCRKKIGNYKNLPKGQRRKYSGFISSWLLK
jgi:SET domain-containing protein